MVAPSRWRSGGESQPVEPPPHYAVTAQPGADKAADGSLPPSEPSPRRTRPSNATARPGLPDKPASRRTSEQKRTDEEQVRHTKQLKYSAQKDAYQQISVVQANMTLQQEEITKDRAAVRPKPRQVVRKRTGEVGNTPPVLGSPVSLPARNPCK